MGSGVLDPVAARAALGAGLALAAADGEVQPRELRALEAAARALGVDMADVRPVTSAELAVAITDPETRTRVVQALEILALMDGRVDANEVAAITEVAAVLGVHERRIHNLSQIQQGHHRLLQLDLMRRSPMGGMGWQVWADKGLAGVWKYAAAPYGWHVDAALAAKYEALSSLAPGTFGRTYWAHMRQRGFAFPGEPKGFPEELVRHDLTHVLSGYDTDVAGEVANAAFISGCLRDDPFSYLFMVVVHTHLDIEVFPDDPSQAFLGADPERIIEGWRRGLRVRRDLYDLGWDFWSDFPRPIAEVRAEFGID